VVRAGDPADHGAGRDGGPDRHRGAHRLVLRAQAVGVREHDHAPSGHGSGKSHRTGRGGQHRYTGSGSQVDAQVAGAVLSGGRLETMKDRRCAGQRQAIDDHGRPDRGSNAAIDRGDRGGKQEQDQRQVRHTHRLSLSGPAPERLDPARLWTAGAACGCGRDGSVQARAAGWWRDFALARRIARLSWHSAQAG